LARQVSVTSTIDERAPPRIERVSISTDSVAPSDRFEWWRSEFSTLHKVEIAPDLRQTFAAYGEHWLLGSILIGRYRTPARRVVRTSLDVRRSEVDHWVLRVATNGVLVSRGSSGDFRAFPGQVAIGSFAQSYSDDYSAGEWIAAIIPRHVVPMFGVASTPFTPGLLSGSKAGLLGDFLVSLVQRLSDANPPELPAMAEMTCAMIASCLAGNAASSEMTVERSVIIRERIDRLIRDNLASARLNPERICALAGISRSTLYRLFEDRGGVAAYVQVMRLKRIRAQLSDPRLASITIAGLAAGQGMHNTAAFNRAFRQHFGCTPGEVRAAVLHTDSASAGRGPVNPAPSFASLLR
jgi:AraC-like DNA-binding protein